MSFNEDNIYVDDLQLDEFLTSVDVHDLVRKHILVITRNFD